MPEHAQPVRRALALFGPIEVGQQAQVAVGAGDRLQLRLVGWPGQGHQPEFGPQREGGRQGRQIDPTAVRGLPIRHERAEQQDPHHRAGARRGTAA